MTPRIAKESLLALSVTTIGAGTSLVGENLTAGIVLVLIGIALIGIRGYLKN
jgi:hypothetical protein